jgi:cyclase
MEKKMFLKASFEIFEKAKALRDNPTQSEMVLWGYLQKRPLGYKFRRQHPIKIFVLDFYCHELRLAIEADGSIHLDRKIAAKDEERQKYLEEKGISFLRFTNEEIEKRLETVAEKIENHIINHPKFINKKSIQ